MDKLEKRILNDLLLTKAMADSVGKVDRWNSLNDIVDELLANNAIDRDSYLHSIMTLTQLKYINSDIESKEDIEMSEAVGFDIRGLTASGIAYIDSLLHEPMGDKVKAFFKKFDTICGEIADSGIVKLTNSILLPALGLL